LVSSSCHCYWQFIAYIAEIIKKKCTLTGASLAFYDELSDELFTRNGNGGGTNKTNQIHIHELFRQSRM
jgi:hypothetical protein